MLVFLDVHMYFDYFDWIVNFSCCTLADNHPRMRFLLSKNVLELFVSLSAVAPLFFFSRIYVFFFLKEEKLFSLFWHSSNFDVNNLMFSSFCRSKTAFHGIPDSGVVARCNWLKLRHFTLKICCVATLAQVPLRCDYGSEGVVEHTELFTYVWDSFINRTYARK